MIVTSARAHNYHVHSAYYRLLLVDGLVFVGAFYLAAFLYFLPEPGGLHGHLSGVPVRAIIFALASVGSLMAMGLYQPRMREGTSGILLRTTGAFTIVLITMSLIFYLFPELYLWRGIFLYTTAVAFVFSLITRSIFIRLVNLGQLKTQILVYGSGEAANAIITSMRRKADRQGFSIVGFVHTEGEEVRIPSDHLLELNLPLPEFVAKHNIAQIVVAVSDKRTQTPVNELVQCRMNGVEIIGLVNFFQQQAGKILVDFITPGWLIYSAGFKSGDKSRLRKRSFDIVTSFFLVMLTWPIMLLTVFAIWLEDGFRAPIVFRQNRVGLHGKVFQVLKFRSMTVDAEGDGKARWATSNDSRITRVGRFIRKVRIDELPQIINVLAGDMAFIGPRPERPEFVHELAEEIPFYDVRHSVKPGITGWAQLCYPYGATTEDSKQKLQFDLYYVKNHNLFLDFMILLTTVEVILFGKGAR
ncbi:MAG: TIGR03013 family PEP-CTERM/XrtA system glycosyltransferase [Proteobacteria bacterium]|nr:TIGR03013 family PEP-CTERM/XrtA system glycosyltransferase [Pseudomonadota bacterium]